MNWNEIVSDITIAGIPIALLSFLIYMFNPDPLFIYIFGVGIAMMVGGYTIASIQNHRLHTLMDHKVAEGNRDGFIMSLDGPYVPCNDDATIEILE